MAMTSPPSSTSSPPSEVIAASSPEVDAAAALPALPVIITKDAAFVSGTTTSSTVRRRPGRLRVIHPHVAALLRASSSSSSRRHAARPPPPPPPAPVRYACAFDAGDVVSGAGVASPGSLVWGKVRRHPWWPGQVFDAADASPAAWSLLRRPPRRRAGVLVAYFWDKTFAWHKNHHAAASPSTLLPFRAGFPRLAARAPVAAAVAAALREVSRRVSTGLSCSCRPSPTTTTNLRRQVIDNAGVREGAYGAAVDAAFARGALRGEDLVGYLSALATAPLSAGADAVDLAVAAAQVEALGRWRGAARGLPAYTLVHGIDGLVSSAPAAKRKRSSAAASRRTATRVSKRRKTARGGGDDDDDDDLPLPAPPAATHGQQQQQMAAMKVGKRVSRAARQISLWPVILRANGTFSFPLPPPAPLPSPSPLSSAAPPPHMVRCAMPADSKKRKNNGGEREEEEEAGLVLKFRSAAAVPPAGHLARIFSRFGPVKEVRAENSTTATVVFRNGKHADEAFAGTARIGGSFCASLISFRVTSSLLPPPPAAPAAGAGAGAAPVPVVDLDLDLHPQTQQPQQPQQPEQSVVLDESFVEALLLQ